MKYIAFKRAKSSLNTKGALPDEYIVEFADTSLFTEGFHSPKEYEILDEAMFKAELAKNPIHLEEFERNKLEIARSKIKSMKASDHRKKANEKATKRKEGQPERPKIPRNNPKERKRD